jgi:Fur family peroxide stress response transcriptional regulator
MRHSRQRDLILDLVRSRALNHPTAQDVHDAVRDHMPGVSLGTVYRNLHQLVEQGEIVAVQAEGPLHYDWNRQAHHHLHCSRCGALVDLPLELEDKVREKARHLGHSADTVDIHVRGTCSRCLNTSTSH